VPTALAIHPLSKLRDLSKLRGILANRIKVFKKLAQSEGAKINKIKASRDSLNRSRHCLLSSNLQFAVSIEPELF
jgi:hypothetical protein